MFKEIDFWYDKQGKSIVLDADASKESSGEVSKLLDVSLIHIDTYLSNV